MSTSPFSSDNDVAVVGLACRFPGASDAAGFWRNLREGVESVRFFSDAELAAAGVDPALLRNPNYVKAHAALADIELFDADFFGVSPREAEVLDPQQRVFLECAWEALEDAGHDVERYPGSVGVFAGAGLNYYLFHNLYPNPQYMEAVGGYQVMLANGRDFLPTRVSYKLNLRGPSVNVQTACSTSLVAVHLAVQSLLMGECDMALAGAVSLRIPQTAGYLYEDGMIFSPDGHCRAFDAEARGIVVGDGVGIVVLKRLSDAIRDRDAIRAVIKGSAINNDGGRKVGYTAPSIEGQAAVISEALEVGRVDPDTVTYVEAHGTATPLGDPIEVAALTAAFRQRTKRTGFCALGSVKSNFGHLDTAAGVAGLIKTILAMENRELPPSLHFNRPNPQIDFANSPFRVNTRLMHWRAGRTPLRAGVSSFGIGGTNAHVVLEQAPEQTPGAGERDWQLVPVSARSQAAMDRACENLAGHLKSNAGLSLADVSYTLAVGRKAFEWRRAVVAQGNADAAEALARKDPVLDSATAARGPAVAFLFSGQGSQYANMAAGLYRAEPAFREELDRCFELLTSFGFNLRDVLFPTEDGQAAHDRLAATAFAQPALFSVEYALARTLIRWGVVPDAMCGHSIGEYVAACIAEVFSLEDALRLVVERGRLMQEMEPGVMMAVPLAERALRGRLNGGLSLAAVNAPSLCVVSGTMAAAATLERACAAEGIACRTLHTSHAFHSAMMDPVLDRFLDVVRRVDLRPPRIPYISNLTGTWVTAEQATDPAYWAKQLRQTVRFDDGVRELARRPSRICVEVGPGRALTTLASTHLKKAEGQIALSTIRHPSDTQEDLPFLLKSVGALWTAGANIDWPQFYSGQARNRVPLPTYPFERKRFWVDPVRCDTRAAEPAGKPPVPRREMEDWFYVPVWKPTPIPQRAPAAIQDCLIFSDGSDLARAVAQDLRRNGVRVATVGYALACPATGEPSYTIDPADPAAYAKLLAGIDRPPRHIIHFWSCSDGTQPESLSRGMYSLVHLAQALGRSASTTPLTIDVVTNGVLSVAPGEETRAEKATLLGPVRVIPQEYEGVQCRLIDLGPPSAKVPLEILMAELESTPKDSLVAYRGRTRWVQMFEPSPLPRVEGAKPLRPRGTYLITGGTGGIGLVIARYLARAVEARLVLITRSQFPARSEWKPWLESHSPEDAMSTKIATILEIEEEGGSVLVLTADVSDRVQLAEAIAKATAEAGPIHGIFHCAGVPGGGAIQQRSIPQIEATLAPKLAGTLNLESIFEGTPIDFLVICSSLTSIQGGFGQMDYCAANAFLDAFAEQRARQGQSVSAINWGAWEKVGMAANAILPAGLRDLVVQTSGPAIPPEQGADALARAMVAGLSRVAIVPYDFRATRPGHLSANEKLARPAQARPELGNDHVAPRDDIERQIAEIWQELLGVEGIGVFDSFLELGGHSLLATQLMSRVRARCGIALPMAAVFEDPTIAGLASRVTALRVGAQLAGAPLGLLEAFEEEGEV